MQVNKRRHILEQCGRSKFYTTFLYAEKVIAINVISADVETDGRQI